MGGVLTAIAGVIPNLVSGIIGYFNTKMERNKQLAELEHLRKMAAEERLRELALDKSKNDSLWALNQLRHTDKWMRRVTFFIVWAPIILGAFFPMEVKGYFDNVLSALPEWWIGLAVGVTTAVFGIREILRYKSK